MKTMLCLKGSAEAEPIIQKVKDMGLRAAVVDPDPACVSRSIADEYICADHYNAEETLRAVIESGIKPDAVLSCAGDTPHAAAAIAEHFGLPGLTREQAQLSVDKWQQKRVLDRCGIPVPGHMLWNTDKIPEFWSGNDTAQSFYDRIPASWERIISKPLDSRGGRGVVLWKPGLDKNWIYEQAKSVSPTGRVMVEEYLDGPQLSTESIVQDGKVLFTAVGLRNYARLDEFAPFCIEDGFFSPSVVKFYADEFTGGSPNSRINDLIEKACRALDWFHPGSGGTVKGDLVIHDGKLYIIELAARLSGGFFATHGHPLAYGVDFIGAAIRLAMGEYIEPINATFGKYVCQHYLFPNKKDIGKRVTGLYSGYFGSDFSSWNIRVGDTIQPVTHHGNRLGQVICTGQTADETRERAEAAVIEMKKGVVLE